MKFSEFIDFAVVEHDEHPEWRWGQTLMNCLWNVDKDLWARVTQTGADCFYLDRNVGMFMYYVSREWRD